MISAAEQRVREELAALGVSPGAIFSDPSGLSGHAAKLRPAVLIEPASAAWSVSGSRIAALAETDATRRYRRRRFRVRAKIRVTVLHESPAAALALAQALLVRLGRGFADSDNNWVRVEQAEATAVTERAQLRDEGAAVLAATLLGAACEDEVVPRIQSVTFAAAHMEGVSE